MANHATLDTSAFSYTIVDVLGPGGMSQLFLAMKQHPQEPATLVTLKTSWRRRSLDPRRLAKEPDLGMAAAGPGAVGHLSFFQAQ